MPLHRHLVIYDETCGLCRRCIRLLQRLDWLGRFACAGQGSRQARDLTPRISRADLERSLHVRTASGQVLASATALRFIALRLPLTTVLGLLLRIPGTLPLASWAYAWISRHRRPRSARQAAASCPRCEP